MKFKELPIIWLLHGAILIALVVLYIIGNIGVMFFSGGLLVEVVSILLLIRSSYVSTKSSRVIQKSSSGLQINGLFTKKTFTATEIDKLYIKHNLLCRIFDWSLLVINDHIKIYTSEISNEDLAKIKL